MLCQEGIILCIYFVLKLSKKYPFKMISDVFHYQEMLSLDAMMQDYFNFELHITEFNLLTGVFMSALL